MQQLSVKAHQGAVVSIDKYASQAGVEVLRKGGNAVDAAIATAFVLAVTHPFAGNIGGGGFMLIRLISGEEVAIDFREMAPALATPEMFLNTDGSVDYIKSNFGYLVAAVPGTVKGLEMAWQKYGSLPWATLLQPAINLAQNGIYLNKYDAASLVKNQKDLARFPESVRIFFKPDGRPYTRKDLFVQPDLAQTLREIAQGGAKAFYEGKLAEKLVADMQANGGIISLADLKTYEAKIRKPVKGTFAGYEIIGMPLPSSGGIAVQQMLNVLKNFKLDTQIPLAPQNLHLLIQTMRYTFLDRTTYLGDTDFVEVPIDKLLSEAYAKNIAAKIDLERATPSERLSDKVLVHNENMETTHFSVVDKDGNMVSTTVTLEEAFGSKAVVKDLGFLLNCEMHDFNINPRQANFQGITPANPNGIAPRKRMLSSMTPTLVLKEGKPFLVTGSPGGRTILNTVLQIILNTTLYNLPLRQALELPRLSHHWMPDTVYLEKDRWDKATVEELAAKGHVITEVDFLGDAHSILINPETDWYEAEADNRRAGWAEGY
ncbi:gamma-glutamyltransferase [Adhaeribacter aerolatus]|uniref:Glutathione hydrolase proenzyme n=1 Tax=Adhaeribacter aerolatus TaxID=670289 RepID=A0A512AY32_9BACT|nr:gamma-glutamyltransferase [Adhaeribacter aerolatus]GEO04614.1 gamma-glutamyltransferase [Adhaeribacter aerolatus]